LADDTRRAVFEAVTAAGSATATEVARALPVTRQAVVKHLQTLADAGLVHAERQGREQRYAPVDEPFALAQAWMDEVGKQWDVRLTRLRARAQRHPS
jgi:DNA-binding transcriptional ArsR family regulator